MKTKVLLGFAAMFLAGAYAQKECNVIERGKAKASEAYEYIKKYLQKNANLPESTVSEDGAEK